MPTNMTSKIRFMGEIVSGFDLAQLQPGCVVRFDTEGPSYFLTGIVGKTATTNTVTGMVVSSTGGISRHSESFWARAANPGDVSVDRMLRTGMTFSVTVKVDRTSSHSLETQPVTQIAVLKA